MPTTVEPDSTSAEALSNIPEDSPEDSPADAAPLSDFPEPAASDPLNPPPAEIIEDSPE